MTPYPGTVLETPIGKADEYFATTADGRRLHVLDHSGPPSRTPVICIPGMRSNLHSFDVIAPHIAKTRRVLCIGLRGRGRSDYDAPANYGLKTETSDVFWVSQQAGIARAVLLGVSRSGFTALALAARNRLAAGLVLIDAAAQMEIGGSSRFGPDLSADVSFPSWEAAATSLRVRHAAWAADMSDKDWHFLARQLYRESDGRIVTDSDALISGAAQARNPSHPSGGSWAAWSAFDAVPPMPMLVLRGEFSDFVLQSTIERMKAMKPQLIAATVKGRGHPPLLNERDLLAAIDSFLEMIP